MNKLLLISIIILCVVATVPARKVKVPASKATSADTRSTRAVRDTLIIADKNSTTSPMLNEVVFSGYDKVYDASTESIFVTNNTKLTLNHIEAEIRYKSTTDAELHARTINVNCDIPPGATRQINFRSWDRQKSFYYEDSRKPLRRTATPYRITFTPLRLTFR